MRGGAPPFSISSAVEQSPVKGKVVGSIPTLRAMREVAEAQSEHPGRRNKPREDDGLATATLPGGVILPSRREEMSCMRSSLAETVSCNSLVLYRAITETEVRILSTLFSSRCEYKKRGSTEEPLFYLP